jgi:hypothetical protein
LLGFAIHPRQNETLSRKSTRIKKQCVFTAQCHMADWCNRLAEVWPWPPISSSFTEAGTRVTVRELSDTTLYATQQDSVINVCVFLYYSDKPILWMGWKFIRNPIFLQTIEEKSH